MKTLTRLLALATLVALAIGSVLSSAQAEIVYRVNLDDRDLLLIGTIHLTKDEQTRLSEETITYIESVDSVWLELAPNEMEEGLREFLNAGNREEGFLEDAISIENWQRLTRVTEELSLQIQHINGREAWFVQMMVLTFELTQRGYDPEQGLDKQVEHIAAKADVKTFGLETVRRQIQALQAVQDRSGEDAIIEQLFFELGEQSNCFDDAELYWQEGDLARLDACMNLYGDDVFWDELLIKRNQEWLQVILNDIPVGRHVIAVGAGHLGGENGLLKLLEAKGAKVKAY